MKLPWKIGFKINIYNTIFRNTNFVSWNYSNLLFILVWIFKHKLVIRNLTIDVQVSCSVPLKMSANFKLFKLSSFFVCTTCIVIRGTNELVYQPSNFCLPLDFVLYCCRIRLSTYTWQNYPCLQQIISLSPSVMTILWTTLGLH